MKTTYLLLSLFLISQSRAEPPEAQSENGRSSRRLSLNEVTAAVVANNPSIKEALAKWEAKKKRITQDGAWDDLRVSAMSRTARFVNIPPNAFTDESVSIEQAIPLSGRTGPVLGSPIGMQSPVTRICGVSSSMSLRKRELRISG